MSRIVKDLKVGLDQDLKEVLKKQVSDLQDYRVLRKSVDARKTPYFVYTVEAATTDSPLSNDTVSAGPAVKIDHSPIIVGAGPAGLFAALRFVERGVKCRLLERGSKAEDRIFAINRFWRYGEMNPDNNVCFGEGGAGLYSDGKLITRIKSPHIKYVMDRLVQFGAPAEIKYLANPHVGSDKIRRIIPHIRKFLTENGCELLLDTPMQSLLTDTTGKVTGVKTPKGDHFSETVILACGHSAEDVIHSLVTDKVQISGKSFAVGLRIEHPQSLINKIQYRSAWEHPRLGAANYKLTWNSEDTGVYSFCMCPGGYVLSSGTEYERIVSNGMSNFSRGSKWANSAVVATIDHDRFFGKENILAGMEFRESLERKAFQMVQDGGGSKEMPAQKLADFIARKRSSEIPANSCPSGVVSCDLHDLFPEPIYQSLKTALTDFDRKMKGFLSPDSVLYGVETRTSCPVRIDRDSTSFLSPSHPGLYPCGEGAGYAGGITSAACDGIRIADKICEQSMEKT